MMRFVVLILAVLAAGKVWTQDRIFRSAAEDALLSAYRAKAIETCRKAPAAANASASPETANLRQIAQAFAQPLSARLEIGNPDVDVHLWDVDHAAWAMRFKYPYIVLDAGAPAPIARCSYDVTLDKASITLL